MLTRLGRLLDRLQPHESLLLGIVAGVIGVGTGAGIWIFKQLYGLAGAGFGAIFHAGGDGSWWVALSPVAGGLIVGLIAHRLIGHERHHGVAGIIEAVALAGGRLRWWRMPIKTLAAALGIGSGASIGPEDPSVQIGSNLGSLAGQKCRFSDERMRTLVAAGAAAGIAAAFKAPIAGVFFALEIILGDLGGRGLGAVMVAAVLSATFTHSVSGSLPEFTVPTYAFRSAAELPLYALLGVFAGLVSAAYVRTLSGARAAFGRLPLPGWVKPALAGALVGGVGLALPEVLGIGYGTIEGILHGHAFSIPFLLALLAAKLVLTPVSVAGGFLGGVFAPALFLGATLGAACGEAARELLPDAGIEPAAIAMAGMAAVLAGSVHAPLTATLLLFELTYDYHVIVPVLFAVVIAQWVARRFVPHSIYASQLADKGVHLREGRDVDVLERILVSEVMEPKPPVLHESDGVAAAAGLLLRERYHGLPVLDHEERLVGIVTVQDLQRARAGEGEATTVGAVCTRELVTVHPDDSIGTALRRMSGRDLGRLPVVAREDPQRLLGVLRRGDVVRAYDAALVRGATTRQRAHEARLGILGRVNVEEIEIEPSAPCAGRAIADIAWPRECVIATVRRGHHLLIPHGDTILRPGDVLTAVVDGESRFAVIAYCRARTAAKDAN